MLFYNVFVNFLCVSYKPTFIEYIDYLYFGLCKYKYKYYEISSIVCHIVFPYII